MVPQKQTNPQNDHKIQFYLNLGGMTKCDIDNRPKNWKEQEKIEKKKSIFFISP